MLNFLYIKTMTENFEDLINEIYRDIAVLSFPFHIKSRFYRTNRNINIEVKTISDVKPALLQFIKEAAPSIDDVSVNFELYNDTFKKTYNVYNPYLSDTEELFEITFAETKKTGKEEISLYEGGVSGWEDILKELEDVYNIKITKTSAWDDCDFSENLFHLEYDFITMRGGEFTDYATVTKSDLVIIATVLSFHRINQILVLSELSVDAQSLLKNLYYKDNIYVVSPDNPMAAHIAGKADVIISDYKDYNHINIWDLHKGVTIVNLNHNTKLINPLKERHYDNVDKIYYIGECEMDVVAYKTMIKLWNETKSE